MLRRFASVLRPFSRLGRPGRGEAPPPRRFAVQIVARSHEHLLDLNALDLDVFAPTASIGEDGQATIEGYLTLDEIGLLVERGYRVSVEEEASKRFRADQSQEFDDWVKGLEE
jgi:hypothetical protein